MEKYEKIVVMGLGSAGRAALDDMNKRGIKGVKFISIKDDGPSLPIETCLAGTDMLFLAAGPDGDGVTEAIRYADTARKMGVLTLGIAFVSGNYDIENVKNFKDVVDAMMPALSQEEPGRVVEFISDLINKAGFINLEFSDIRAILSDAGYFYTGVGVATGKDRAEHAARNALRSLHEYAVPGNAGGIILGITAGPEVGLIEVTNAAEVIKEAVVPGTHVVWAHILDDVAGE